ncbi:cell division protein FtsA [Brevibacillus humidisoli]|uniref:cell division protein FtsA n=1 Tax=Brevibacillus humidisoli TaxID=2895522 RepID=UPI001E5DE3B1|nr:cell division protein FtsA [Brevibacillus humidisoli]UFJ39325.1 cell division protein FtsA [Brevibacillus humidisoli]
MSHDTPDQHAIFALDIGTRSVVGLIVEPDNEQFNVIDCEIQEHDERSMLDGQIHDVVAVAKVIEQVKNRFAEKHGPLRKVAVAAAGRSLRTRRVQVEMEITHRTSLTRDDILTLEFTAVQEAQAELAKELNEQDTTRYYCVGYSVVNYYLDGEVIGSLVDQRGDKASIDVIATFLPRVVVDSLLAALKRCDLEMQALTLEPIAAINVLIPVTMRRLNIALVDIGAGTSDVALTEEGTITAYGMVPVAGDEITDGLMNAFLLDFSIAETVKRKLIHEETIQFQDILGIEHTLSREEVVQGIESEIDRLAGKIAEKIMELNGKPPQAVMLIGGGSLTPKLPEKLAASLKLPANRVAVRGADAIQQFIGHHPQISGPEFVTPVGIAVAARKHPIKYMTVTVNDNPIRIFDLRKVSVGDSLLTAGLDIRRLYGRPGLAKTVTLNGRMRIIPGGHGTAPAILQNGEQVGLDAPLSDGDVITVVPGQDGAEAEASIAQLLDEVDTLDLTANGKPVSLAPVALVNGQPYPLDAPLSDRDQIEVRLPRTVGEALQQTGLVPAPGSIEETRYIQVTLNGQNCRIPQTQVKLTLNGKPATAADRIRTGDDLYYAVESLPLPTIQELSPSEDWSHLAIHVTFNGRPVSIRTTQLSITMDGKPVSEETVVHDGAVIAINISPSPPPVFNDIFRYVDVELTPNSKEGQLRLMTTVNSEPASFQTPIKDGDVLELYWES